MTISLRNSPSLGRFSNSTHVTSGWLDEVRAWQERQRPQASGPSPSQSSAAAKMRATLALPTLSGPRKSSAWGT